MNVLTTVFRQWLHPACFWWCFSEQSFRKPPLSAFEADHLHWNHTHDSFCRSTRLKKQWKYSYSVYHSIYEYVIITISNKDSFCRKRAQNVLRSRRSILYAANQLMRLIRPRARTRACGLKSFLNLMLWGFDRVILCRISETRKYCIGVLHRCECSSCSA